MGQYGVLGLGVWSLCSLGFRGKGLGNFRITVDLSVDPLAASFGERRPLRVLRL